MRSQENSYTPDQIEILRKAFDLLVKLEGAASDADREDLARSLLFEARRGVSSLDDIVRRVRPMAADTT